MHAALTTVVSAIPLPTVIIGVHERIVNANAPAVALFGENLAGRHHVLAFRQPQLLDAIETSLRTRQPGTAEFDRQIAAKADIIRASVSFLELEDFEGVIVCFEDITQIRDAGQIRRDFVANVSHELRTPLTAILGFVETIKGPARNDFKAIDRFLGMLETEAHRMTRLVQDLLSLSRVESEERVRPTTKADLVDILSASINRVAKVAEDAKVRIEVSGLDQELSLPGDPDQLSQVFTNLLENAVKYGGQGGKVSVSATVSGYEARMRGPAVRVDIQDTGPGIPNQHLPRLTERFYRVDSHRSREMGGTGLGLAIVKHILNRHRGRLRVTSEIGEGSCFSVFLPLK